MKTTVLKDGHQFIVHILDPREDPFADMKCAEDKVPPPEAVAESERENEGDARIVKKNMYICCEHVFLSFVATARALRTSM